MAMHAGPRQTIRALDATLGHPSLPQSATGQSTLLTGSDGVALMGRPFGPWPGPTLVRLLQQGTLFHDAARLGGARLANAYSVRYLEALANPQGRHRRLRPAAALVAARAAGVQLCRPASEGGDGVAGDLGDAPELEAERFAELARQQTLTYLDVAITDQVGHRADLGAAVLMVAKLERFVAALVGALDPALTLLIVSDHGNLEDATSRRHTRAPVPMIVHGPLAPFFRHLNDLRDLAPALRSAWSAALLKPDDDQRLVPGPEQQQ